MKARLSDLLRHNPTPIPESEAFVGKAGYMIEQPISPHGITFIERNPGHNIPVPDELRVQEDPNSPQAQTYSSLRATMDLLGITFSSWVIDQGKKLRGVRVEKAGGRYIDWRVNELTREEYRKLSYPDRDMARCGAISVWLWAIGTLIDDDPVAKQAVKEPPRGPDDERTYTPAAPPPADLPTVGPPTRGRRLGPFPSRHRQHNGAARDNCHTPAEHGDD